MEVLKFDYTMWNLDAQYPGRCYMENYAQDVYVMVLHALKEAEKRRIAEKRKEKPTDEKN